jgi:hypothetical protein
MVNALYPTQPYKMFVFLQFGMGVSLSSCITSSLTSPKRKPLSFHSISFGPDISSSSLRRMANVALGIQNNAPRNPQTPATASVPSSFAIALDTVRNLRHLLQ